MLKIVTTLLALALGSVSAWAGPREDCFSGVAEPDTKIAGCTVLLQKRTSNRDQAIQYNNRCIGYSNNPSNPASSEATAASPIERGERLLPRRRFFNQMPDKGLFAVAAVGGFLAIFFLKIYGVDANFVAAGAVLVMLGCATCRIRSQKSIAG